MKNHRDFIKLFDLNIPNIEHFDYYIDQLSKTSKFSNIYTLLKLFEEIPDSITDFYEYKTSKSHEIIEFIKKTNAYVDMCYDKSLIDLPTTKSYTYFENVNYLSFDLRSANWFSLKKYDQQNELGDSYSDFLTKFQLPQIFFHSKYLRQFIFGNINPKKQQKVQRNIVQELVRKYSDSFTIECVKSDEVVFSFKDFNEIESLISEVDSSRYRSKIFTVQRVDDFRVDTIYDISGNLVSKQLVGVPQNQFYIKLKEYITGEKIDLRDLYFKQDKKLAVWVHDSITISNNQK